MNEEGAPFDSGFDDAGPFSVTPEADGVALDAALREFGPAAFDDLLPRLRAVAADLDAAHRDGFVHGRLHPSKILVTDDGTYLLGARVALVLDPSTPPAAADRRRWPIQPPYTAPEVVGGAPPGPTADQYSLAAITYEWMSGRPIAGPAERSIEVRSIPNVDRAELARAFTRALTPEPFRRFASCADFCDAVAAASASALPLLTMVDDDVPENLETFLPETPPPAASEPAIPEPAAPTLAPAPIPDLPIAGAEPSPAVAEPDLDSFEPVSQRSGSTPAMEPPLFATADRKSRERFGGLALILATIVGAVFGFAAGYMARPRALQTPPVASEANDAREAGDVSDASKANEASAPRATAKTSPGSPAPRSSTLSPASPAPPAPAAARNGRLLVRSTPNGADVQVDGVSRGVTPLALRDLDLGAREITVSRRGYVAEERRIVLTEARPSRSVDVRLAPQVTASPRPSTPASLGKPAVTTGTLVVESRPAGASITVNGKPSGVTPLTISDLAPGDYRVTLTLDGHQAFTTTVRVVAGERARAAARLTEQEQE